MVIRKLNEAMSKNTESTIQELLKQFSQGNSPSSEKQCRSKEQVYRDALQDTKPDFKKWHQEMGSPIELSDAMLVLDWISFSKIDNEAKKAHLNGLRAAPATSAAQLRSGSLRITPTGTLLIPLKFFSCFSPQVLTSASPQMTAQLH